MRLTLLAAKLVGALVSGPISAPGGSDPRGAPSGEDVGQRIVTGMAGHRPSQRLLRRVRRGEVGTRLWQRPRRPPDFRRHL